MGLNASNRISQLHHDYIKTIRLHINAHVIQKWQHLFFTERTLRAQIIYNRMMETYIGLIIHLQMHQQTQGRTLVLKFV